MNDKQKKQSIGKENDNKTSVAKRRFFRKKVNKNEEETDLKDVKWVQIRLLPIWLRMMIMLVLVVAVASLGGFIGYSIIGDGTASELFKKETWTHITDIIQGVE